MRTLGPTSEVRTIIRSADAPRVVCLFFDLHGDFRMTLKTNVPPREAAAPSIVERVRECVIRTPRWREVGLFLSSRRFWLLSVLCSERESPSPAIKFAERAER